MLTRQYGAHHALSIDKRFKIGYNSANVLTHHTMNLSHHLLIAMPGLSDTPFKKSVVYLCQHDKGGAMGLIINQPSSMRLCDILESLKIETDDPDTIDMPVLNGGPLKPQQGFVIHRPRGKWKISTPLAAKNNISTSQDILESIANGDGPKKSIILTGYCGWEAGQLEEEIADNDWLCVHIKNVNSTFLYDEPYRTRWQTALKHLGIAQIHQLSTVAGNA